MRDSRVRKVKALPDYLLFAEFADGEKRLYDIKPLFEQIPAFNELKRIYGLFKQAQPDTGGHGIVWNDNVDLDADEVYDYGAVITDDQL